MGKVVAGSTVSLDGYIARPNESGFEHLLAWFDLGDIEFPSLNPDVQFRLINTSRPARRALQSLVLMDDGHILRRAPVWLSRRGTCQPTLIWGIHVFSRIPRCFGDGCRRLDCRSMRLQHSDIVDFRPSRWNPDAQSHRDRHTNAATDAHGDFDPRARRCPARRFPP